MPKLLFCKWQNYTKPGPPWYNIKLGYFITNDPLINILWSCQHTKASVFVHKENVHSFRSWGFLPAALLTGKKVSLEKVGQSEQFSYLYMDLSSGN